MFINHKIISIVPPQILIFMIIRRLNKNKMQKKEIFKLLL